MTEIKLPTGKLILLLLGLCRQGQSLKAVENDDGRLWFRWGGLRGGIGGVGILKDHHDELAVVERASTTPRAYVELLAILTCVVVFGNVRGAWALERVAELLYGPRSRSSHRERQLPPLHAWLALLEHGYWQLDTDAGAVKPTKRTAKKQPVKAEVITGSLLCVEVVRDQGRARTLVVAPAFLAAIAGGFAIAVPSALFRIPDRDHHNPEGNLPSLAVKARVRLAAAIAARWRQATDQPIRNDELLSGFAGLELERVERRGHISQWAHELWRDLRHSHDSGGPGLDADPVDEKPLLRTKLRLIVLRRTGGEGASQQASKSSRRQKRSPG